MKFRTKQLDVGGIQQGQSLTRDDANNTWIGAGWFEYSENESLITSNSTSYQESVRLTLSAGAPPGVYCLSWFFVWGSSSRSGDVQYEIRLNGGLTYRYDIEAMETYNFSNRPTFSGSRTITIPSGAGDFVAIRYRTQSSGRTVYISDSYVSLRFISNV